MQQNRTNLGVLPMQLPGNGLNEIFGTIRRRLWVLVGTVCISLILGAVALMLLTPKYTAEAMVLIESEDTNRSSMELVVAGQPVDAASVQSEAYVLNSRNLAHRVIDKLQLLSDPEFNSNFDADNPVSIPVVSSEVATDPESIRGAQEYHVVTEKFHSRLSVTPQANSRVIAVSFVSPQPEKARLITNTLLDQYILSRLEAKYESTKKANIWLNQRISDLSEQVEQSESEVGRSRQSLGLIKDNGVTLNSQELSEINAQLIMSRAQRAEAEVELRELKRLANSPEGLSTASQLLDSSMIRRFREEQAGIRGEIAELSSEYGVKHPRMINLVAEDEELDRKIADEVNKTIAGLENDVSVARARERSLAASLDDLKVRVAEGNQNSIGIRMLEREAEANRSLLTMLLAKQKETISQNDFDFQKADARVISYADIPIEPSFPNNIAIIALVLIGSGCLGLFLILLLELLDQGVHGGEELAEQTGAQSLGFSPFSEAIKIDAGLSAFAAIRHSAFGQAIKTLNWSVRLGFADDNPPKIILVTSSVPKEGKSTIATSMAFSEASTGSKVLLIDADMRCPTIHTRAGVHSGMGLVGFLQGKAGFDEVVVQYEDSELYVLPAGAEGYFDSEGLVSSDLMDQLINIAVENFDMVIIDSPPVMACSDARILAKKSDATVFVVRWGSTKISVVQLALEQLSLAGANLAGVFLSMVNVKRYSTYEYGDSSAYTGEMAGYYTADSVSNSKLNRLAKKLKYIRNQPNLLEAETSSE
jgi:succinoglycan biosynthesis transport protein ExoP